jgi:prepilin-type N-terminal cleavage/methylation domain-containing protein
MKPRTMGALPDERGFSLIELLIVVGLIVIMAGVAAPSIAVFIRNYKINGTEREVTSMITTARSRAISRNTQAGVSFEVVDANTYRIVIEDVTVVPPNPPSITLGELHDLPSGLIFQPPPPPAFLPPNATYFRFNRLGGWCDPSAAPSLTCPAPAAAFPCPDPRCTDNAPGGSYITSNDPASPGSVIGLLETNSGLRRVIRVQPGGRIQTSAQ